MKSTTAYLYSIKEQLWTMIVHLIKKLQVPVLFKKMSQRLEQTYKHDTCAMPLKKKFCSINWKL